jgi:hypothetical protein
MGMDCRKIEQLISPFLDGELTPAEALVVKSHLTACAVCHQEYEELAQLSSAMAHIGPVLMTAPAGFKDTVMLRITEEKVLVPVKKSAWYMQSWRQVVASAAAAVLLIFGAVSMNTGSIMQLAKTPVVEYQPSTSNSVVVNPTNNMTPSPPDTAITPSAGIEEPTSPIVTKDSTTPVVLPITVASNVPSAPVFLIKERTINTTLLKIKIGDSALAEEKVLQIARDVQALTQNLGVQVNEGGSYTAIKITVAKASANTLMNKLSSLGTVVSQELDKQDISTRYAETLSQYQTLVTQRATLQDLSQKVQLDQRIETLQNELTDWEQKAEQETIVLWLEK